MPCGRQSWEAAMSLIPCHGNDGRLRARVTKERSGDRCVNRGLVGRLPHRYGLSSGSDGPLDGPDNGSSASTLDEDRSMYASARGNKIGCRWKRPLEEGWPT